MDPYDLDPKRPLEGQRLAFPETAGSKAACHLAERLGAAVSRFRLSGNDADPERRSIDQWLAELLGGGFDDVLFLTRQGVRVLLAYAGTTGREDDVVDALAAARCVAGEPTVAEELARYGLRPAVASDTTSEGLLAELGNVDLSNRTVALQLYGRSRETVLRDALRTAGAELRVLASGADTDAPAIELAERIEHGRLDAIFFTSSIQIERLLTVAASCRREDALRRSLAALRVVAVGPAAASSLRDNGIRIDATAPRSLLAQPQEDQLAGALGLTRKRATATAGTSADAVVRTRPRTVVVVGNGMVGHRFCERIVENDDEGRLRLVVFGEERRPAYDRVNLTSYFSKSAEELQLADPDWYEEHDIDLRLGEQVVSIDRERRTVRTDRGAEIRYETLVLATGSAPFVPPVPGMDLDGVFVYRTLEDLDAIRDYAKGVERAAVIGGGLLGLEAAKAVHDLGVEAHVIEFAPRLMPRQLDDPGASLLRREIEALGVQVHVSKHTTSIRGDGAVTALAFADGSNLDVGMIVVSAGIRPRSELAERAGLAVGERGGIVVGDDLRTADACIYAIGECALHRKTTYGLVAPGYEMADALAKTLAGEPVRFEGADTSTKLKLLGVDVASLGSPLDHSRDQPTIGFQDLVKGTYKKLVVSQDRTRLTGAVLVGDTSDYTALLHYVRSGDPLPDDPEELILGARGAGASVELSDALQVCSCNNVTKGEICAAMREQGLGDVAGVKSCTKAGSGCGGCLPIVTDIVNAELAAQGKAVERPPLCEHFSYTRQELYEIVKVRGFRTFAELLAEHGQGSGCEICKPAVASIFASTHNELITKHETLQDTNDRYLANIQRKGLYSVIPRIPGGEITPDKLIRLGELAKKYDLYTKITGAQRIDLLGARLEQLPDIWEELVQAGFESGHAYGKAVRTVKSCVGSTWCRYGVQDSVAMAIRVEERYKGIRAPHKLKGAVSGCIRECAEAQGKDFGLIATERGFNVYVCGNGGAKPRHADLLAADVDAETAIRYIDRFLMYYIKTADKLTRTSVWMDKLEGGIAYLREVVIDDRLGICEQLEQDMQHLVDTYACEWAAVVKDPEQRRRFRHFANSDEGDDNVDFVIERGQRRPIDWDKGIAGSNGNGSSSNGRKHKLPVVHTSWVAVGRVEDFPRDGGRAIQYGDAQIAVFNFESRGEWYAVQNTCPHRRDQVLARGIIGDAGGVPKVACPLHKKTFSLESGECMSGEPYQVRTFQVKVERGVVHLDLPPEQDMKVLVPSCRISGDSEARAL